MSYKTRSVSPLSGSPKAITEAMTGRTGDHLSSKQLDRLHLNSKPRLSRLTHLELLTKLNEDDELALEKFAKNCFNPENYLKPVEVKLPLDKPLCLTLYEEAADKSIEKRHSEAEYLEKIRSERVYLAELSPAGKVDLEKSKQSNDPLPTSQKDQKHLDLTALTDQKQTTKIHLEEPSKPPKALKAITVSSVKISERKSTPGSAANEKCLTVDKLPNELNISIECIADCAPDDEASKLLVEERKYWRTENEILKAQKQELASQLEGQKQQNVELAKSLQSTKLKVRENENALFDLHTDYYKQYDLFDQYHRAFLNLSNFTDLVIKKLTELDTSLNVICRNRFLDFDGVDEDVKTSTIDEENIFVVAAYLRSMELKIDNLLIDSIEE